MKRRILNNLDPDMDGVKVGNVIDHIALTKGRVASAQILGPKHKMQPIDSIFGVRYQRFSQWIQLARVADKGTLIERMSYPLSRMGELKKDIPDEFMRPLDCFNLLFLVLMYERIVKCEEFRTKAISLRNVRLECYSRRTLQGNVRVAIANIYTGWWTRTLKEAVSAYVEKRELDYSVVTRLGYHPSEDWYLEIPTTDQNFPAELDELYAEAMDAELKDE